MSSRPPNEAPTGPGGGGEAPQTGGFHIVLQEAKDTGGNLQAGFVSLLVHAAILVAAVYLTVRVTVEPPPPEEIRVFELVEQTQAEAPPEPPPPPDTPPPPTSAPEPMDFQGFQTLAPPDVIPPEIPPPSTGPAIRAEDFRGEGVRGGSGAGTIVADSMPADVRVREAPTWVPHTVPPRLVNPADVERALVREYPAFLRDAGIGGTVLVWVFVGADGTVQRSQVQETSGHEGLDAAALRVAPSLRFSPAQNLDQTVEVWVQIPITFQSRS